MEALRVLGLVALAFELIQGGQFILERIPINDPTVIRRWFRRLLWALYFSLLANVVGLTAALLWHYQIHLP